MTQTDQTQVPTAPETTISPEELAAFRAYQARIQRDQRDKELRDTYAQLVDDEIDAATDMLTQLSTDMATIKETVMSNFRSVIDMKTETLGLSKPQGQYTHLHQLRQHPAHHHRQLHHRQLPRHRRGRHTARHHLHTEPSTRPRLTGSRQGRHAATLTQ